MESLLANYADDEEDDEQEEQAPTIVAKPSILSSLPQPKSSSPFLSLPKPNSTSQTPHKHHQDDQPKPIISNCFSSLPPPKSNLSTSQTLTPLSLNPNPKRVVQFNPPINPSFIKSKQFDEDDEDFDNEAKPRKNSEFLSETTSVMSFLSTIPAPRNSEPAPLGLTPASGAGRRSVVEADVPASSSGGFREEIDVGVGLSSDSAAAEVVVSDDGGGRGDLQWGDGDVSYGNYENYGNYEYESKWVDRSSVATEVAVPEVTELPESARKMGGKRGRNEVPIDIVEVKQDELIKNRPREDQVKLTGIAFGPSYQPVSTKGKPTKLHKRKHQIGSLYFDMKQKEMELSERRSKGFLTKAETQAKYGW